MVTSISTDVLAAKDQIRDSLYLYCRSMDRIDRALGLCIWAPGAVVDYGTKFRGSAVDFIEKVSTDHEKMEARSHQITNIIIELDIERGRANSEAYVIASLRDAREGARKDRLIRARYLDRWILHESRWLIDHRTLQLDLVTVIPQ